MEINRNASENQDSRMDKEFCDFIHVECRLWTQVESIGLEICIVCVYKWV